MAFLRMTLCAAFMVTLAISKPVSLGEGLSESSESSESNSSEERAPHVGLTQEPLQEPAFKETGVLAAMEEADPPGSDAAGPSLSTSALPDPDPQASTDASPLMPDGPSPTPLGRGISQNSCDSGPGQDPVLPDTQVLLFPGLTETDATIEGTDQPQVTAPTTYIPPYQGATAHVTESTPPPSSTATPLPIPISTALTGLPVCFSFQFTTPEPEPPRGGEPRGDM